MMKSNKSRFFPAVRDLNHFNGNHFLRLLTVSRPLPVLDNLRGGLQDHGFQVDFAGNDIEGDERIRPGQYDAALVDFSVPQSGGAALVRSWRGRGLSFPVVMLFCGSPGDQAQSLDAGANGNVNVSFKLPEVLALLRSLKHYNGTQVTRLKIADLELDLGSRAVQRSGTPMALTSREFELLCLLARNRGRCVTRTQIGQHLYDGKQIRSNAIEVLVNSLRNKVDKGFGVPLILTRRGSGYWIRDHASL